MESKAHKHWCEVIKAVFMAEAKLMPQLEELKKQDIPLGDMADEYVSLIADEILRQK